MEFVKAQREPEYDDTVTQEAEKETEKESSEEMISTAMNY